MRVAGVERGSAGFRIKTWQIESAWVGMEVPKKLHQVLVLTISIRGNGCAEKSCIESRYYQGGG